MIPASIMRVWQPAQRGRSIALSTILKCEDGDLGMRAHLFIRREHNTLGHRELPVPGGDEGNLHLSNRARCSILTNFQDFPLFSCSTFWGSRDGTGLRHLPTPRQPDEAVAASLPIWYSRESRCPPSGTSSICAKLPPRRPLACHFIWHGGGL